jgi:hypothetical protein
MQVWWLLCGCRCGLVSGKGKSKPIPLQALTDPEGSRRLRLPGFKTIGTCRWQGCQPYAPAAFTPRAIVWPEGLCQWKNPVISSGIESTTFWFVVQYLNHYAAACPRLVSGCVLFFFSRAHQHKCTCIHCSRRLIVQWMCLNHRVFTDFVVSGMEFWLPSWRL